MIRLSKLAKVVIVSSSLYSLWDALVTLSKHATHNKNDLPQPLFVPSDDSIYAHRRLSERSFEEVRATYKTATELGIPLELVQLPEDIQGEYRPSSLDEFIGLAHDLIEPAIKNNTHKMSPQRSSIYAIVTICIDMEICNIAEPNQRHYADKHGYDYIYLSTSIKGVPPKLLKYLLLTWAMGRGYDWLLLLDADALITNSNVTMPSSVSMTEEFTLEGHAPESINLLLTRGGQWRDVHAINNGVFLMRNSPWSYKHCYEIFTSRYAYTRFLGKTLIDQPIQLSLLIAQNELEWPPKEEVEAGEHVLIVPKHRLNPFRRSTYYSQQDDKEGGQWRPGDFLAHFASRNKYSLMISFLEEENLAGLPPIESRFQYPLPAPGDGSDAGNCWCSNGQINCIPKFHVIGVHKAGSKSLMRYLAGNPDLSHSPHVEDRVRWLTDNTLSAEEVKCKKKQEDAKLSAQQRGYTEPAFLNHHRTSHGLSTCSFNDYALLHGKFSANEGMCPSGKLPEETLSPMFDEMVIWEDGQYKIRGVPLPELFHYFQPSAHMIITLRDAVDVFYSAYNHFGKFEGIDKSPLHFNEYAKDLINAWREKECTAANFRTCIPSDFAEGGSWLSRAMYSEHIPLWLESYGCGQVHLFDVSVDPMEEVQRLYNFVGAPNDEAALKVTAAAYRTINSTKTKGNRENALNKNSYLPMMEDTRALLNEFYRPYNGNICELFQKYPCLRKPLFEKHCNMISSK